MTSARTVRATRILYVTALVCTALVLFAAAMFGTLLSCWFGNRPVNARIVGWTPDPLPADWAAYRATWENAHAITAGLAGLAGVAFVALLVLLWPPLTAVTEAARPGAAPATESARAVPGPSER